MSAYWESFLSSQVIVVSFDGMSEPKSQADILRVLYQFASRISGENRFKVVKLARSGNVRFFIEGDYFRQIGLEYAGGQNPVYLMRTLPENIYGLDGKPAFGSWSGGMLGVLNRQMEDLNTFMKRWIEATPTS